MGTPFDTIYDRCMVVIKDYKLDALAKADYQAFIKHLQGILELTVTDFVGCLNSLSYDINLQSFVSVLTNKEINILAKGMVIGWFTGETQTTLYFQPHLSNKEFKIYSEANNLKEKSEYLDRLREKYNQDIIDYQLLPENMKIIMGV